MAGCSPPFRRLDSRGAFPGDSGYLWSVRARPTCGVAQTTGSIERTACRGVPVPPVKGRRVRGATVGVSPGAAVGKGRGPRAVADIPPRSAPVASSTPGPRPSPVGCPSALSIALSAMAAPGTMGSFLRGPQVRGGGISRPRAQPHLGVTPARVGPPRVSSPYPANRARRAAVVAPRAAFGAGLASGSDTRAASTSVPASSSRMNAGQKYSWRLG